MPKKYVRTVKDYPDTDILIKYFNSYDHTLFPTIKSLIGLSVGQSYGYYHFSRQVIETVWVGWTPTITQVKCLIHALTCSLEKLPKLAVQEPSYDYMALKFIGRCKVHSAKSIARNIAMARLEGKLQPICSRARARACKSDLISDRLYSIRSQGTMHRSYKVSSNDILKLNKANSVIGTFNINPDVETVKIGTFNINPDVGIVKFWIAYKAMVYGTTNYATEFIAWNPTNTQLEQIIHVLNCPKEELPIYAVQEPAYNYYNGGYKAPSAQTITRDIAIARLEDKL